MPPGHAAECQTASGFRGGFVTVPAAVCPVFQDEVGVRFLHRHKAKFPIQSFGPEILLETANPDFCAGSCALLPEMPDEIGADPVAAIRGEQMNFHDLQTVSDLSRVFPPEKHTF